MDGWESARLGDVCYIDKKKHNGDSLPFLGMEHIESGSGQLASEPTLGKVKSSTFYFNETYLLYGRLRPYLNKVFLPDFQGHCSTEIFPIKCSSKLNRRFLFYWLITETTVAAIDSTSTGTRMPRANVNALLDFNFPLPPLPKQKQIVAILDKAFAAIETATANTKKNLTNARELFESQLKRAFTGDAVRKGWTEKNLDEVCLIRPPKQEAKLVLAFDDKVSFVPMKSLGIRQKTFDSSRTKPFGETYGSYTYFRDGDVLLAKITPCFQNGKLGIATGLKNGVGFGSSEFLVFRCRDQLTPEYLFYFLSRKSFTDAGVARMSGAVGHQRVPLEFIQNYRVPFPPLTEQKRLVAILDKLSSETRSLSDIYNTKLNALAELKQALLHKSFCGEL